MSDDKLDAALDAEREACARIADGYKSLHIPSNPLYIQAEKIARKIRARKKAESTPKPSPAERNSE